MAAHVGDRFVKKLATDGALPRLWRCQVVHSLYYYSMIWTAPSRMVLLRVAEKTELDQMTEKSDQVDKNAMV